MNKKILKILLINIISILLILFIGEIVSFKILKKMDKNFHYIFKEQPFDYSYRNGDFHELFRPVEQGDNNKGSMILFGCCMTYGYCRGGKDNESLSKYMNKYTNRTIYNRSISGWGLQHMYYQLTNPNFKNEIDVEPEYIIYTIIHDHYRRIFSNSSANEPFYLQYKVINNKLVKKKEFSLFNRSLILYLIKSIYCRYHYDKDLVEFYILESYKQAKTLWPNVKMVIFDLDNRDNLKEDLFFKENGIQVIDVTQYSDNKNIEELPEYQCDDSGHAGSKYWNLVLPKLVKDIL